jgi:hypothetical protein
MLKNVSKQLTKEKTHPLYNIPQSPVRQSRHSYKKNEMKR